MTYKNIQLYFFLSLVSLVFIMNVVIFLPFLKLFAILAILTVVFYPLYKRIKRNIVKNSNLASLLTIITISIIVIVPITFFLIQVFSEAKDVYATMGSLDDRYSNISNVLSAKLQNFIPGFSVDVSAYVGSIFDKLTSSLGSIFSSLFHFITIFLLSFVAIFFFLRDGDKFISKIIHFSPLDDSHDQKILAKLKTTISAIVKGSIVIALIQGVLTWVGFLIFGVPNPALWGAFTIVASLIPGIGTAIVVTPAIIYLFYTSTLFNAVGLLVWGVIIVGLIDNAIRPILVSKDVDIHPFMILMSIFGGILLFGAAGFLLGPLFLSFFYVLVELYPLITKKVTE